MADEHLTDKAEILARMETSYRALRSALGRADAEQLERPGAWGEWTLKDLVAHITYWQSVATDRLQKFGSGRAEEIRYFKDDAEINEVNENVYRANKDRPLAEMLEALDVGYQSLRTAVKSIPADVYPQDQEPVPVRNWVAGNSFAHYEEHTPDIERALQHQSQ